MPSRRRSAPARSNLSPHTVHHLIGASIADLLRASSELRIEELLDARPWTTSELAAHTGTAPHWLHSILRGLAAIGLIRRVEVEHMGSLWSTNRVLEHPSS
jgi:predicted transcriptional regulator